jgi:DNA-binding transcriptional ArsR family regulator
MKLEEKELVLQTDAFKKAIIVYRAINNKYRQQILQLLDKERSLTVTQIYVKLRMEQSIVSLHLSLLRKARLVHTKRDGKFIYYSVNYERIKQLQQMSELLVKR